MKALTRTSITGAVLACACLTSLGLRPAQASGQDKGAAPAANKYIGADKCKSCHGAAESGDQYGHWKGMKHAKAFETLASEDSKKLAAAKGIADAQKSDDCVKCHVTAFGVPEAQIKKGFDRAQGVQCESCHGPGEQHMKARFAAAAKGNASQDYVQVPADEIIAAPKMAVCVECHNERSPSYKEFCYHEFNAEIRHLNPKKPRTTIDIGACTCPKCASGCPESCKTLAEIK
ncbi:MAG: hypothetical protein HOP15_04105 [Planctomycetes bacterium]|nr:hypothetical protein [Planctomycetota bacterium]